MLVYFVMFISVCTVNMYNTYVMAK